MDSYRNREISLWKSIESLVNKPFPTKAHQFIYENRSEQVPEATVYDL